MRVLSYNIKGWRGDLAALLETVRDQAPDVLVLQEVLRWTDPGTWCIDLAARFGMAQAVGGLCAYGNAIVTASDVTVLESRILRYPPALGDSPRAAVFLRGTLGGTEFVAAGTHLATVPEIRLRQATSFKQALYAATAPVIAGVDVNETDAGPAWQTIAEGLVDAGAATGQAGIPTFSTTNPNRRIDALFADPALPVTSYQVLDTPAVRRASDHFPILGILTS